MDDEYVTIPRETLSKILDNEIISKEHDAKIMIENSITNRWILCTGLIIVGLIIIAWIITPGDVQVHNKAESVVGVME